MSGIDWPALMRTGIKDLRLQPAEFWSLTPAELGLMLGLDHANAPMGRGMLDELIRAYPDEETKADG